MANNDALFPSVSGFIDFETLMAQARQALSAYSATSWSNTEEHDPGVTLLQAMAYNTSDLGYRSSLPLTDLLTPAPPKQLTQDGIFPADFGPQRALTCGPITEDDYRRALLDLRSSPAIDGYFLFDNVQLVREPEGERYQYWYNIDKREYSFTEPEDSSSRLTLLGNYFLYVQPSREAEADPETAQGILDVFLRDNRNLGEAVSRVIWLKPEDIRIEAVIELADDVLDTTSIATILAAIYTVVEQHVTPPVQRSSTAQLQAQGWRSEDIYQGPYLQYGWIPQLPPPLDEGQAMTVNLAPVVNALLAIDGVKSIRSLGTEQSDAGAQWIWTGSPGCYPRPWGAEPIELLSEGEVIRLLAHGINCGASASDIRRQLTPPAVAKNPPVVLPYGRWRNPAVYHPVTNRIPPCYGLSQLPATPEQIQLHQFLLPFEQLLANGCKQLALLPNLLAFRREINDVVWGEQWPFQKPCVSNVIFKDYATEIEAFLNGCSHDMDKELSYVDYLLGYFGGRIAPRTFMISPKQFMATQQGYLGEISNLEYQRANIRIDKVSALQQRIAARLGIGGDGIFNADAPLDKLPFYLVEHRALLPAYPDPSYDELQTPLAMTKEMIDGAAYLTLTLPPTSTAPLRIGQVVNLIVIEDSVEQTMRGLMISRVDSEAPSFSVKLSTSAQLERNLDRVLDPNNTVHWQNSPVWMIDMNFRLVYAVDQSLLAPDERRLTSSPQSSYPALVKVGDRLVIRRLWILGLFIDDGAPVTDPQAPLIVEVTQADSVANTLVVKKIGDGVFPDEEEAAKYYWYFESSKNAITDNFSFMVSVVFDRDWLYELIEDHYAVNAWVQDVILDEFPSYISMLLHWMPSAAFKNFAATYNLWQNNGAPLGDDSYSLMSMLTLGMLPSVLTGIGAMRVATPEQKEQVVGPDGDQWNIRVILEEELFFVPPNPAE
ncbi:hypothetical protein [Burkholderia ubonensis]|uniref:hypothetical protein n=1 Tax=Burkholderia ubonensis TaxID=101571 RepID=UPI0007545C1F|nr:hypothetical protein [Burkholderia ubonensis]KVN28364.1 hypothetical protein WJ64_16645 [Burkholderia ubonensis]